MSEELNQGLDQLFGDPDIGAIEGQQQQPDISPESIPDILSQYGVPDDVIGKVKNGTLMQSDYTRKTQELSELRRSVEAQQQQINNVLQWALSQQQGQPAQTKSHFEKVWEETTGGQDAKELEPMKKVILAAQQDAMTSTQQQIGQLQQQLAMYQADEHFNRYYETVVKPNYGDHLNDVWKQAVEVSKNYLRQGQMVDPIALINQVAPEKLAEAAYKAKSATTSGHPSEGMVMQRTSQPQVQMPGPNIGPVDSTQNILREALAMTKGRVSA